MIVLLYGANELAIQRRLAELRAEADGGSGMLESNLNVVDGRDAKPADILGPVMSMPFLAPKRLVIVENLLERFESRPDRAQPRSLGPYDPLFAALESGMPDSTILVFLGQRFLVGEAKRFVTPGNALVRRLKQIKGVKDEGVAELKGGQLIEAIRAEAERRAVRLRAGKPAERLQQGEVMPFESDPATLMASLLQGDMLAVANELDKLALYTDGGDVTVVEVNRVCAGERISTEFEFGDAVMDGDLSKALEALSRLKRDGVNVLGLLALLFSNYRRAATIIDLLEDRATPDEIGKAMGRSGQFPNIRDQAIRRARNLGPAGLHEAYECLVHYERTFKQGEIDEEVGFDVLVMRLSGIARPAARAR